MKTIIEIAAAVALSLAASVAAVKADELRPDYGRSIDLGEVSGVAYYTVERGGYHVVATLAERSEESRPMRVEATLAPGQSVTLSSPSAYGGAAGGSVEILRSGDAVLVRKTPLVN